MDCKKCKAPGTVLLRKKDSYCEQCFITNTTHKFRACIGKNRILSSNDKVLIAVSGGLSSSVLLDLVHNGVTLNSHKILRISPVCVHITGLTRNQKENVSDADAIIKQCNKYGFDVFVVPLCDPTKQSLVLPEKNCITATTKESINEINSVWEKHSSTSWNDIVVKLRRHVLIRVAYALQCNFVFTAETTTTLASSLLSNLSLGRGSQIEHDAGFIDTRDDTVKILRPMKDISQEELANYASLKKLTFINENNVRDKSLQSLIHTFVVELQHNFPATISTVYKTSEKIGTFGNSKNLNKCIFCQSEMNVKNFKLTALEATKFSQAICYGKSQIDAAIDPVTESYAQNTQNTTSKYCYACKRNQGLLMF